MRDAQWLAGIAFMVLASQVVAQESSSAWQDPSPHSVQFITVDDNVKLEVLDWGGSGPPLVFLAGLGNTAHIFDTFAPRLTERYRVIAITRRGYAPSGRPATGYDFTTMAGDIRHVCDAFGFDGVVLVGHSIAGEEMTKFATLFPKRLRALVYLDAAYDRTEIPSTEHDPQDPATPEDLRSIQNYTKYLARLTGAMEPEADVRAVVITDSEGRVLRRTTPAFVWQEMVHSEEHPDYVRVRVPALAIFAATNDIRSMNPDYDRFGPDDRRRIEESGGAFHKFQDEQMVRFRREVVHSQVVRLTSGTHYVFLTNGEEVERLIREFLRNHQIN